MTAPLEIRPAALEPRDDVVELLDADHGFGPAGGCADVVLANLRRVADSVDAFVAALG